MYKKQLLLALLLVGFSIQSQIVSKDFRRTKFNIQKDSVRIDSVSINSQKFKVLNAKQQIIDPQEYQINFIKALLIIDSKIYPEITVEYFRFPEFVTKVYAPFDKKLMVPNRTNTGPLYKQYKYWKTL